MRQNILFFLLSYISCIVLCAEKCAGGQYSNAQIFNRGLYSTCVNNDFKACNIGSKQPRPANYKRL